MLENYLMARNYVQMEVLLITGTSFLAGNWVRQHDNVLERNYSDIEQLQFCKPVRIAESHCIQILPRSQTKPSLSGFSSHLILVMPHFEVYCRRLRKCELYNIFPRLCNN